MWLVARLVVEQRAVGDGDHAGVGVDGKAATGIVGQAVGDGAAVDVAGGGGDPDHGAVGRALGDVAAGRAVAVGRGVAGATSLTATAKVCELVSVPSEAWTVMLWLVAVS